jgi:hypothetical protein
MSEPEQPARFGQISPGWDASPVIGNSRTATGPHVLLQSDFRAGLARLTALGLSLGAWVYHPQHVLDEGASRVQRGFSWPGRVLICGLWKRITQGKEVARE